MAKADLLVSVVAVVRDRATVLPGFVAAMRDVLDAAYANSEILLIDNGSTDQTFSVAQELLQRHSCVRYLRLTRSGPDEIALVAGLDAAIGDYVVTLDAGIDPPECVPELVERSRAGNDLVIGTLQTPKRYGPVYRVLRSIFRSFAKRLTGLRIPSGTTHFRCLSRQAVNALVRVRLRRRYFGLVAADVGLAPVYFAYDRLTPTAHLPGTPLFGAIRLGLSVLVHNSIAPLRWVSVLGLLGGMASIAYSGYVLLIYLLKDDVMPGWTTLSLQVSGSFMIVFLMLSLMGEYLGRLLEESSDRPLYHVFDERASAVMLADVARRNVMSDSIEKPS